MADNFKTIFELDAAQGTLLAELDATRQRYVGISGEMRTQEQELQKLLSREKALIEERKKAQNPNQAVKYNEAIKATQVQIGALNKELEKTSKAQQQIGTNAKRNQDQIGKAFNVAAIQASRKQVQEIGDSFREAGDDGKAAGEKPLNAFTRLRQEVKLAKGELEAAFESGNQEAIQAASDKLDDLNERMENLRQAGSKLERLPILFQNIASNIFSLDFKRANEQSKQLLATSKSITFKEALGAVKNLGSTLVNIGRSLLANPLFLIGALIGTIIAKFDALRDAGGLIGEVFNGIASVIDTVVTAGKDLLDLLGIIDSTKRSLEELIDEQETVIKTSGAFFDRQIALRKAGVQSTIKLENERANAVLKSLQKELKDTQNTMKEKAVSREDFVEFYKKSVDIALRASDVETARNVRNTEVQIAAQNKLRELRKDLVDEQNKLAEFDIKFKLNPDSSKQIKADFALQLKELAAQQKEERRQAAVDFVDFDGGARARALIDQKFSIIRRRLKQEEAKELIDSEKKLALEQLDIQKDSLEKQTAQELSETKITEEQAAEERLFQTTLFYQRRFEVLKAALAREKAEGLSTVQTEKEIAAIKIESAQAEAAAERTLIDIRKAKNLEILSDEEAHQNKMKALQGKSESQLIASDIEFEKRKLDVLKKFHSGEAEEIKKQQNLIEELEKEHREKRIQENLDYLNTIVQATIAAANQIIQTKINELDKQTEAQQKRVDEATNIAGDGNAELLELEKKRLDDLNKEKEKFVRQQQALATIELIANTAIAVSKAAAQGGVAAGVTIAAALIALIAGLATARSVASQAAFYEGGEYGGGGYTGDGNPREQSLALGPKPYIYHKRERIFNHRHTGMYGDIFDKVAKDKINLREWEAKVKAYDLGRMNENAEMYIRPMVINSGSDLRQLEKKMDAVIRAIESQEGFSMNITDKGIVGLVTKYNARKSLIKSLAE